MAALGSFRRWFLPVLLLTLAAGAAAAQQRERGLYLSFAESDAATCFSHCVANCTFAYHLPGERPPTCVLTDDVEPDPTFPRPRRIYWRARGRVVTANDIVETFPGYILNHREAFSREVYDDFVARIRARHGAATPDQAQGQMPSESQLLALGQQSCAAGPATQGDLWVFLHGTPNASRYRLRGIALCSEAGDAFFVPVSETHLQRYNCRASFQDCRRSAAYDAYLGPSQGPGANGITDSYELQDARGRGQGTFLVAF